MLALVIGATGAVDPSVGDVGDVRTVEAAVRGVDVVFHLAARLHLASPHPDLAPDCERTNVDGTAAVVAAAHLSRAGAAVVKRLCGLVPTYQPNGESYA